MEQDFGLLNLRSDEVTYTYKGETYRLSSNIYEPCLFLRRDDALVCVLHNAYTTEQLVRAFTAGKTIKTGFGKDYDKEYDDAGFRRVLAAAIDSGRSEMDLFYAAKLAKRVSLIPICRGEKLQYKGIRKIHEGKFITRYDVDYETAEGHEKTYEMISRNKSIQTLDDLQNKTPDSVIMILTDESGERILVSREYRMAMAQWIYNFPAGLIDPGETPVESAKRELWEETGLTLTRIDDVLDNSYSAIGFSNERNVTVFGVAAGEFRKSTSDVEEIIPGWYSKEEIRELLRTEPFAARTQAYCYEWASR